MTIKIYNCIMSVVPTGDSKDETPEITLKIKDVLSTKQKHLRNTYKLLLHIRDKIKSFKIQSY